ncbi:MAG: terminase large subunit, partial [Clostridia bacterium]|nr:terminase large subunit [Clostridia bacterium]
MASWPAEQGRKQYEVMKSALGARTQPLIISISTSGYINDGIFDDLMARSTAFLQDESKEKRLLPLYMIDDLDKWDDMHELRKANPNLGVSVSEGYYLEEIAIAEVNFSKRLEFLTKYCNVKQSSTIAWLPAEVINATINESYSLEDFRDSYCVGGIDLSQTTDLTACCVIIEKNAKLYTFTQFFMPKNKLEELKTREGVPYEIYDNAGILTLSGDNYVDYNDCYNWFVRLVEEYEILPLKIGYDRYTAQYLVQDLNTYGFHTDDVFQGENLTPVIKEAEGLIRDKTLVIGKNQLLKAHLLNTALKHNAETRKVRIVKVNQTQ